MKKVKSVFALLCLSCVLVTSGKLLAQQLPVNPKATTETKSLYTNLQQLAKKGVMFGHQDDLAYGVGWKYVDGESDVKKVVGDYPAVYGWDISHLELDKPMNLDSVPFHNMREYVQQVYAKGGVNTFSWHLNNPVDPSKSSWDAADPTIQHLFSDKKAMKRYKSWLDKVAVFMKSLKGPKGEMIPVVFRPFHEHTGSWFWWGKKHCSPEEYKKMWRFTIDYLRKKQVNNLLIAYSTDRFTSKEDYLERYPGDEYVDIVGFDIYHRLPEDAVKNDDASKIAKSNQDFVKEARQMVETLRQIGQERNKVWALTETGLETLPVADWWTNTLLPIVKDTGLSYVLVWRNARPSHHYAPYPGQKSAEDFKQFYQKPEVLFLKKTTDAELYKDTSKK